MINLLIGFAIAAAMGLTGVGGGSFTVPALLLLAGLPPVEAVGTAFVFAAVVRLVAAPFYLARGEVHGGYLRALLKGALPGLAVGIVALRLLASYGSHALVWTLLGLLLVLASSVTFLPRWQNRDFASRNPRLLPWLAFLIGGECGFSSAGAGALGTVLLLNYSEMTVGQVVGTDLIFGLVLALGGSAAHWSLGSISVPVLSEFLAGGVPGAVLGCCLSKKVPARKLKAAVALLALAAGLQLSWAGAHRLLAERSRWQPPLAATAAARAQHVRRYRRGTPAPTSLFTLGPFPSAPAKARTNQCVRAAAAPCLEPPLSLHGVN